MSNLANLVLLCSSIVTNTQTAVTARTNNAAVLTHVETVRKLEVIATKQRFHKPVILQTNSTVISQRKWQEAVPDLTPSLVPVQPASVTPGAKPPGVAKPSIARGSGTNSPAFKRRLELEAQRKKPLPAPK